VPLMFKLKYNLLGMTSIYLDIFKYLQRIIPIIFINRSIDVNIALGTY
jgi:hypothetical protein